MRHLPQRIRTLRASRGFTLVEMLVAITIFAILAAIAIGAFSETGSDRVPAAARQFRAMLAGAQSRAAKDRAARGIRLALDANLQTDANNLYVTSLAFIGANIDIEGALADQTIPATASTPQRTVKLKPSGLGWQLIQGGGELVNWYTLINDGNMRVGDRVYLQWTTNKEIEAQERLFIITALDKGEDANLNGALDMGEDLNSNMALDVAWIRITGPEPPPSLAGQIRYRLEIAPELLPNSEPVSLPRGTVIDLNASKIPSPLRTNTASSRILDIMFDQRGQVRGSLVGEGAVHFYVGQLEDSLNDRALNPTESPRIVDGDPTQPVVYPQRLVSLIPATGQVVASEYLPSNTSNPFYLATQGKEAK